MSVERVGDGLALGNQQRVPPVALVAVLAGVHVIPAGALSAADIDPDAIDGDAIAPDVANEIADDMRKLNAVYEAASEWSVCTAHYEEEMALETALINAIAAVNE